MIDKEIQAVAADARELAERLRIATDALSDAYAAAEVALRSLALGVDGSVSMGDRYDLGFFKVGNVWGLYMVNGPGPEHRVPISHTPRSFRKAAANYLVPLLIELRRRAGRQIGEVNGATAKVASVVSDIENGKI